VLNYDNYDDWLFIRPEFRGKKVRSLSASITLRFTAADKPPALVPPSLLVLTDSRNLFEYGLDEKQEKSVGLRHGNYLRTVPPPFHNCPLDLSHICRFFLGFYLIF
jgi:hypothetical protein